jgi:hypothetical protein
MDLSEFLLQRILKSSIDIDSYVITNNIIQMRTLT